LEKIVTNSHTYSGVSDAVILYSKNEKHWICYFNPPFEELNNSSPRFLKGTVGEIKLKIDLFINRIVALKAFI
jgi:hypothetical protein